MASGCLISMVLQSSDTLVWYQHHHTYLYYPTTGINNAVFAVMPRLESPHQQGHRPHDTWHFLRLPFFPFRAMARGEPPWHAPGSVCSPQIEQMWAPQRSPHPLNSDSPPRCIIQGYSPFPLSHGHPSPQAMKSINPKHLTLEQ